MDSVELIPAHYWICEHCDQANFCRSIVAEFSDEEMAEMRLEHGVDVLEEGIFLTAPKRVQCGLCGHEYETRNFND